MRNTTVLWYRSGVLQRTAPLAVQIQNMAWRLAADLGGQSPYDSFEIYTTGGGIIAVQRGDLLIDQQYIDPLTNALMKFRVFGNPEGYFSAYTWIPAERLSGS